MIHYNPNFSLKIHDDILFHFPNFKFQYGLLSDKKNISMEYILNTPERNWFDYYTFFLNPNITFSFLEEFKESNEINYRLVVQNKFTKEKELFTKKLKLNT